MRVFAEGVGLAGPGLPGWKASRATLAGFGAYTRAPTAAAASELLPAAERRRVGTPVKLALAAGSEAVGAAGRDIATMATVFASSSGDCDNVHHIFEALASPERQVSPTRFHNSVHNAVAGYWSIAAKCRQASTSLCCHDASFAAGLLETTVQTGAGDGPVALIAYDHPYPEPLNSARPVGGEFGVALVLAPRATSRATAALDIEFVPRDADATRMDDAGLEALRCAVPAARSLPLLAALAGEGRATVILGYVAGTHLRIAVAPCA
ncbi:MAG TPA: beta-ketoacyl synthase chain length factor [Burkholderiales bacterium]|nr:beta-ketoacyl synthase chain length factor [Burkholderiales bacterium]